MDEVASTRNEIEETIEGGIDYLQLLYREVKGILLYQGFPRPILSQKIWSTALNVL